MIALHHVQVACPPGGEDQARRFYVDALGLTESEKPPGLRSRGGAWFRAYDVRGAVTAELHVGVEDPFLPARKAHPAFLVGDLGELDAVAEALAQAGFDVDRSQEHTFAGHRRLHTHDPHGNRVEVLAPNPREPAGVRPQEARGPLEPGRNNRPTREPSTCDPSRYAREESAAWPPQA